MVVVALMVDVRAGPPPAPPAPPVAVVVEEEVPGLAVASLNEGCRLMLDEEAVVVEARADCGIAADEGLKGASCFGLSVSQSVSVSMPSSELESGRAFVG